VAASCYGCRKIAQSREDVPSVFPLKPRLYEQAIGLWPKCPGSDPESDENEFVNLTWNASLSDICLSR
jgi:hypothetical protein